MANKGKTVKRAEETSALTIQAEEISALPGLPDPDGLSRDEVHTRVINCFESIREGLPYILRMRRDFAAKPKDEQLFGCRNWREYCERFLHRTDRRVRQLLAENLNKKPKTPKPIEVIQREAGTRPPKGSEMWDSQTAQQKVFGYAVNAFGHLAQLEQIAAKRALADRLRDDADEQETQYRQSHPTLDARFRTDTERRIRPEGAEGSPQ